MQFEIEHNNKLYDLIEFIIDNRPDIEDKNEYITIVLSAIINMNLDNTDDTDISNILLEANYVEFIDYEISVNVITDLMMSTRPFILNLIEEFNLASQAISWDIVVINSQLSILTVELIYKHRSIS